MSGPCADFPAGEATGRGQFAAAIALSCLLHLALGLVPLGKPQAPSGAEPASGLARAAALSVKLAPAHGLASAADMPFPEPRDRTNRLAEPAPPAAAPATPTDAPSLAGRIYHPAERLTKHPQPTVAVDLEGPELRPVVASGRMVLRVWIDDDGGVADAEVETSELPPAFARVAIAAFRQTRFIPGELDGRPVRSFVRLEIGYEDNRSPRR